MKRTLKQLREETGVATVSSPEVGDNIQYPIGQSPNEYKKRNEQDQKNRRLAMIKRWTNGRESGPTGTSI